MNIRNFISFFTLIFLLSILVAAEDETMEEISYALPSYITELICLLLWVMPSLLVLLIMLGGFFYMFGDPVRRNQGKGIIVNAILGLIIFMGLISLTAIVSKMDLNQCRDAVSLGNRDPIADARVNNKPHPIVYKFTYLTREHNTAYFDASKSRDHDGRIVEYKWNFGDGTTGSGISTQHRYTREGTYYASLIVRDNEGKESLPSIVEIIVNKPIEAHIGENE